MDELQIKQMMIDVGKRMDDKNLLVGTGGNFSVRLSDEEMLITASGLCKSMLKPDQITKVDMQGNIICGMKPARDIRMHLAIYNLKPKAKAIVHSHPPFITGFAISAYKFDTVALSEVLFDLGSIAVADYAAPTTGQVPQAVEEALRQNENAKAVVLTGHGALTYSEKDIWDACFNMEVLEMVAKSILIAQVMGGVKTLSETQIEEIHNMMIQN
jgi:L-fuculose-phosphate aldolase